VTEPTDGSPIRPSGARALLEGKGDLGESLFDAGVGGGGEVQRLVAELAAESGLEIEQVDAIRGALGLADTVMSDDAIEPLRGVHEIEAAGVPWPAIECPAGVDAGPCRVTFYKDPSATPAHWAARVATF